MSAKEQTEFDVEALKRAFEANEADKVLQFYSSDLEHIEIDADAPPKTPRKSGTDYIVAAIEGAAQAGIKLRLENPVVGEDRDADAVRGVVRRYRERLEAERAPCGRPVHRGRGLPGARRAVMARPAPGGGQGRGEQADRC